MGTGTIEKTTTATRAPPRPRPLLAVFFFLYLVPEALAIARHPVWVVPAVDVSAMLGLALGGYAILFGVLVFGVPDLLRHAGRVERARQWRCDAFQASLASSVVVFGTSVAKVPVGPVGVRTLVGVAAAAAVLCGLLAVKAQHFDRVCGWPGWSWHREGKGPRAAQEE